MESVMDKLIYIRGKDEPTRESSKIEFEFSEDLDIQEFKTICVRLAGALGYNPKTIKKGFGKDCLDNEKDNKNQTKLLFD